MVNSSPYKKIHGLVILLAVGIALANSGCVEEATNVGEGAPDENKFEDVPIEGGPTWMIEATKSSNQEESEDFLDWAQVMSDVVHYEIINSLLEQASGETRWPTHEFENESSRQATLDWLTEAWEAQSLAPAPSFEGSGMRVLSSGIFFDVYTQQTGG